MAIKPVFIMVFLNDRIVKIHCVELDATKTADGRATRGALILKTIKPFYYRC